jgi:hypothetical protein
MKTYYVKARSNRYAITYGYLTVAKSGSHAKQALQEHLDKNKIGCTVLSRVRVATPKDKEYFAANNKATMDFTA